MQNVASNERGFTLMELMIVLALMAVMAVVAVPSLLSYYQSASLRAGAEHLASVMGRARHLAIRQNTSVCVERTGSNLRFRTTNAVPPDCNGTVFAGEGTDGAGIIQIANDLQVGGATNAIFTNAGGASTPATYSLTDPETGRSRNVVVTSTGRVTIQ
jgi:type IV fimbrial biogenesis protein FimT